MTRKGTWIAIAAAGLAVLILLVVRPWRDGGPPVAEESAGMDEAMPGMAGMEMDVEEGTIRLTADQIRTFGITYGTVERRPIERTIRGTVDLRARW